MRMQTPKAQGRSTKIISMMKEIRTSRLSIKKSLSSGFRKRDLLTVCRWAGI